MGSHIFILLYYLIQIKNRLKSLARKESKLGCWCRLYWCRVGQRHTWCQIFQCDHMQLVILTYYANSSKRLFEVTIKRRDNFSIISFSSRRKSLAQVVMQFEPFHRRIKLVARKLNQTTTWKDINAHKFWINARMPKSYNEITTKNTKLQLNLTKRRLNNFPKISTTEYVSCRTQKLCSMCLSDSQSLLLLPPPPSSVNQSELHYYLLYRRYNFRRFAFCSPCCSFYSFIHKWFLTGNYQRLRWQKVFYLFFYSISFVLWILGVKMHETYFSSMCFSPIFICCSFFFFLIK